jgi:predicted Zn-dependent protease
MNKKLNAYLEAINEVRNFYPLDLVESFENRN